MHEYREASRICFSETWFSDKSTIDVDGFSVARADRTIESTKERGGDVFVHINEKNDYRTELQQEGGKHKVPWLKIVDQTPRYET